MKASVPAALDGERLDRVLAMIADISRSAASDLIATGEVLVNGVVETDRRRRMVGEDVVDVTGDVGPAPIVIEPDAAIEFAVRLEDRHVVVVDKPAGLVVHPGSGHREGTLCHGLVARFPEIADVGEPGRPGIVHRLDRGTSGLLVVARTEEAYGALVDAMAEHLVDRRYRTLVWGRVENDQGIIDAPVGRSQRDPTRMTVTPRGRPARTYYRVCERYGDPARTQLECRLETGRTHQIRVHLSSIGHPIVGDVTYRGSALPGSALLRPWLHAERLAFDHPVTGEAVVVSSPLPDELVQSLAGDRPSD